MFRRRSLVATDFHYGYSICFHKVFDPHQQDLMTNRMCVCLCVGVCLCVCVCNWGRGWASKERKDTEMTKGLNWVTGLPIRHSTILFWACPQTVTGFQKGQVLPKGWKGSPSPLRKGQPMERTAPCSSDDSEPLMLMENGRYLPSSAKMGQTLHTSHDEGQLIETQN